MSLPDPHTPERRADVHPLPATAEPQRARDGGAGLAAPAASTSYTIQGRTIVLPVVVRDAMLISATFVVPAAVVRRLVPAPQLTIPEIAPGRALLVLAAIEYRDNDLGCYNEVAVNFFVSRRASRPVPVLSFLTGLWRREVGAYVHRLPVTTSFSRDAGRDIWGFPKTVDDIAFEDADGRRRCTLRMGGAHVLTLACPRAGRRRFHGLRHDAYAWRDGVLFRTPAVMGGEGVGARLGGAELTLGSHPIAEELRSLGLPKRALFSSSVERLWASFTAPEEIASNGSVRS